jgi:ferric-dicitrate binding protein FerR (iron transport regulator)
MTLDWPTVLGGLATLTGGAAWVGRLQQKVNSHEKQLEAEDDRWEQNARDHAKVQRQLGRIEGKLDILVNGRASDGE